MKKKIFLNTGSSLRHKALISLMELSNSFQIVGIIAEANLALKEHVEQSSENLEMAKHISKRDKYEEKFFSWANLYSEKLLNIYFKEKGWSSTPECLKLIDELEPDLIVVYGSSILKGLVVSKYKNRIINLHLGLSPYYRGSGTNFFPFVNGELEYYGASFLLLNEGIDTGFIIHQIRPKIISYDYYYFSHQFLLQSFITYINLIDNFDLLDLNIKQPKIDSSNVLKVYKRKDFTEKSVQDMKKNLSNGLIKDYLLNKEILNHKVQIVEQPNLLNNPEN